MGISSFRVSDGTGGCKKLAGCSGLGLCKKGSSAQPERAHGCGNLAARDALRHSFTLKEMGVLGRGQGPRTLTKPDRPYSESHKKDIRTNWLEKV